jgi:hypothetical protein
LSLVDLISRGKVLPNHVILQAIQCFVGTINGDWKNVPWCRFPAWNSLCNAIALHGTPAALQLLRGKPRVHGWEPSDINFVCPSTAKLERDAPFISLEEGPRCHLVKAFNHVLHSSTSQLIMNNHHVYVSPIIIAADSQPLAQGCWISGGRLCGVQPTISAEEAVAIQKMTATERHKEINKLIDRQVNGVTEYYAVAVGEDWSLDIGRHWSVRKEKQTGVKAANHLQEIISAAEVCVSCAQDDVDECSSTAWCYQCQRQKSTCADCIKKGYTEWHFLKRRCHACHIKDIKCHRNWVMTVMTDGEAVNVAAGHELRELMVKSEMTPTTTVMYDPYHQARAQRNAMSNHILYRDNSRFCIGLLSAIRVSNNKTLSNKLMKNCSEQALHSRDKHSMDLVRILFRKEVEDVLREAKAIIMTLYPEQYRHWKQKKEDEFEPRYICQIRRGYLIAASLTNIYQVRLSYPVAVTLITTNPQQHITSAGVHTLSTTLFRQVQAFTVWQEEKNNVYILLIDKGKLCWIRLKYKGQASSASLSDKHCVSGVIHCYQLTKYKAVTVAPLRHKEIAVSDDEHNIHLLTMEEEKNNQWSANYIMNIDMKANVISMCRGLEANHVYALSTDQSPTSTSQIHEISWTIRRNKTRTIKIRVFTQTFTNATCIQRYDQGFLILSSLSIDYLENKLAAKSAIFIGNRSFGNANDGPVSDSAVLYPLDLCVEGDTVFLVCDDKDHALRMYSKAKPMADFMKLCRDFMDLWDIRDPKKTGSREYPSWTHSIGELNRIIIDYDNWYNETRSGLALPLEYQALRGPEGVPSLASHQLWKRNLQSLKDINEFASDIFDYDYLQISRFNTMDVEHGFGQAALRAFDRVQTQLTYAARNDRRRMEVIKSRCINGFAYVTHQKGKQIYKPTTLQFPIDVNVPLSFIDSRANTRLSSGSSLTIGRRQLKEDPEGKEALEHLKYLLAKQPQQRLRSSQKRYWSHRPHITQPLSLATHDVLLEVKEHKRERTRKEKKESKEQVNHSTLSGYESPPSDNEYSDTSDEEVDPWELDVNLLVFIKSDEEDKTFYLGQIIEIDFDEDKVLIWWYGGNARISGQWRPLYLDPKDNKLTTKKIKSKEHRQWIASSSILRGEVLRDFKLKADNHIPARVLEFLDTWPGLRSYTTKRLNS